MPYIKMLQTGKPQVMKLEAFVHILNSNLPLVGQSYTEILKFFDDTISARAPQVTVSALANSHGDWYEWMLAIEGWNLSSADKDLNVALPLVNKSALDLGSLYEFSISSKIEDLKKKVEDSSSVQLISSNPDFIIIKRSLADRLLGAIAPITTVNDFDIKRLTSSYSKLIGQCSFYDIVGFISVKTSLRPDRRLQISHEGSLMKAIYVHLQTREWIIDPPGLKYYAMSTEVGAPDRASLKTVATHSITTVTGKPEAAVDDVFEVNDPGAARAAFQVMLKPSP